MSEYGWPFGGGGMAVVDGVAEAMDMNDLGEIELGVFSAGALNG